MLGAKMPNELDWPSLHETLSVLATFTNFDHHPFKARIMLLNSIVPNSSKMKKEAGERKRKKGSGGGKGGREGSKKPKRKEGKEKNGVKKTGMESRRNEVPNETPLRWTLRITEAASLREEFHFVSC